MCGIFAMLNPPDRKVDIFACRQATAMLGHRGPDASGEWLSNSSDVYLGHRRLSIIDLSDRSGQPMVGESGAVLVYNGEVYNFSALRRELEALGCTFRSSGDTEVLLKALEVWGIQCLARFEGMFAFVLWDPRNDQAIAARDFFGIKPLYFTQTRDNALILASEIKSFYAVPEFSPQINEAALPEFLRFRSLCGGQSLLRGVHHLPPGHILRFHRRSGTLSQESFWNPAKAISRGRAPSASPFESVFRDTIERHLLADVPVGMQFSGGVDSTLISAVAARELGARLSGFHCRVEDKDLDELPYASQLAQVLGMDLHVATLNEHTFFSDLLERLTWHHDEPLTHPNSVGIYLVSRLARGNVTVLLSGEAADEFFAGYGRYPLLLVHDLFHRPLSVAAGRTWTVPPFMQGYSRAGRLLQYVQRNGARTAEEQIVTGPDYMESTHLVELLGDDRALDKSVESRWQLLGPRDGMGVITRAQLFDIQAYLPPLLIRQDKMSMAASVENRVPFVTPSIFSAAMNLPWRNRTGLTSRKPYLKSLLSRYVPPRMVHRRKQGFGIPLAVWLRRGRGLERVKDLSAANSPLRHVLDWKKVSTLVEDFQGNPRHADMLWTLLSLRVWMDLFCSNGKVRAFAAATEQGRLDAAE
ncbi:MAG: asparagine synthase (glutamine-hydrolyzing) [Thermodesulfobacteriota bacterium]